MINVYASTLLTGDTATDKAILDLLNKINVIIQNIVTLQSENFLWDSSTSYQPNSLVIYNGVLYYSKVANSNKEPDTNPTQWGVI